MKPSTWSHPLFDNSRTPQSSGSLSLPHTSYDTSFRFSIRFSFRFSFRHPKVICPAPLLWSSISLTGSNTSDLLREKIPRRQTRAKINVLIRLPLLSFLVARLGRYSPLIGSILAGDMALLWLVVLVELAAYYWSLFSERQLLNRSSPWELNTSHWPY